MATVEGIIVQARERAGISAAEEPLEAADALTMHNALKAMLGQWVLEGAILSYDAADLALPLTITIFGGTVLEDEVVSAVSANLALRMPSLFGTELSPDVAIDAAAGKSGIVNLHVQAQQEPSKFDPALVNTMGRRRIGVFG